MFTSFVIKCLIQIEGTIDTPPRNFFVNNNGKIRLCYRQGSIIKYIYLETMEKTAAFLQKHGVIQYHALVGNEVKMYVRTLETFMVNNVPHQRERLVPVTLSQIEITPAMVQTFAAREEFLETAGVMGLMADFTRQISDRVVVLAVKIFKAA